MRFVHVKRLFSSCFLSKHNLEPDVWSVSDIAGNHEFYNLHVNVQWDHCQKNDARGILSSIDRTGHMNIS